MAPTTGSGASQEFRVTAMHSLPAIVPSPPPMQRQNCVIRLSRMPAVENLGQSSSQPTGKVTASSLSHPTQQNQKRSLDINQEAQGYDYDSDATTVSLDLLPRGPPQGETPRRGNVGVEPRRVAFEGRSRSPIRPALPPTPPPRRYEYEGSPSYSPPYERRTYAERSTSPMVRSRIRRAPLRMPHQPTIETPRRPLSITDARLGKIRLAVASAAAGHVFETCEVERLSNQPSLRQVKEFVDSRINEDEYGEIYRKVENIMHEDLSWDETFHICENLHRWVGKGHTAGGKLRKSFVAMIMSQKP